MQLWKMEESTTILRKGNHPNKLHHLRSKAINSKVFPVFQSVKLIGYLMNSLKITMVNLNLIIEQYTNRK